MRKPRDIDTELKALQEKQKQLRARRTQQLGELVIATGADALDPETLAGALIEATATTKADAAVKEAWQRKGEGFFRREKRKRQSNANQPEARVENEHGSHAPQSGGDPAG